ncbi:MAG: Rne/Rng family ribonuclease [Pseudomonadota bacterium]
MTKTMLIDAAHREETRVAVVDGKRIEDFDFETEGRKPLRGNIYLARVTRVEPSLQAAFVEYGGNRHGFLAFSEIHSDYYQIPVADREALRALEAEEAELERALERVESDAALDADDDDEDAFPSARAAEDDSGDDPDEDGDEDDGESRGRRRSRRRRGRRRRSASADADGSENENADASSGEDQADDETDDAGAIKAAASSDDDSEAAEEKAESIETRSAAADAGDDAPEADDDPDADSDPDDEGGAPRTMAADSSRPAQIDADPETIADDEADPFEAAAEAVEPDDAVDPGVSEQPDLEALHADAPEAVSNDDAEPADVDGIAARDDVDDEESSDTDDADDDAVARVLDDETPPSREEIAALEKRYAEVRRERARILRNYKIQEVVKRRQILLVQVVKEERGNKGAALTTYMSLAGRYCVLMPNTARGGGISRKIASSSDRKRLRRVVEELSVPPGMALIVRTAGAKRTKIEIKRDYDYLLRIWDSVREMTLKSIAPCLIYEEASLVRRAIRDLYDKDIGKVVVEGEEGYREAKDFMRMLMPSHAKNVQRYQGDKPLFVAHGVERQLDEVYTPTVKLKSGGYLVIHVTEAMVAVDVNSGKSTGERNIELTAVKTNIEAAHELARQCRLRDLAGLIVIDFIDMEENRHNRQVEKALKEALSADRARIQMGRISSFGLLEMSRQRRRSGIVDGTTVTCPVCDGMGVVRAPDTAATRILRAVESEAAAGTAGTLIVRTALATALHMLNAQRARLQRIEDEYGVVLEVAAAHDLHGDQFDIEKRGPAPDRPRRAHRPVTTDAPEDYEDDEVEDAAPENAAPPDAEATESRSPSADDEEADDKPRKRRRRRRGRRSDGDEAEADGAEARTEGEDEAPSDDEDGETEARGDGDEDGDDRPRKRRRRGRRGGRRNKKAEDGETSDASSSETTDGDTVVEAADSKPAEAATAEAATGAASETASDEAAPRAEPEEPTAEPVSVDEDQPSEPARSAVADDAEDEEPASRPLENTEAEGPPKQGWWSRALRGKL